MSHDTRAQRLKDRSAIGTITYKGMPILIENPAYTNRTGITKDGTAWSTMLVNPYGEVTNTVGADGDGVDVFLGPALESDTAFIVNQNDPDTGEFDEHKCMLGFPTIEAARAAYLANFQEGWNGLGSIVAAPIETFKQWLGNGDTRQPYPEVQAAADDLAPTEKCQKCGLIVPKGSAKCLGCNEPIPSPDAQSTADDTQTQPLLDTADAGAKETPVTDAFEGGQPYEIVFSAGDGEWELLTDAAKGGLMRVRQLAMVVEPQINLNKRYITRDVARAPLLEAQQRARAGAMLTEMRHPQIVRGENGADAFVDNYDRKVSRVDDVHMPDEQGRVYIDRTILDTVAGRAVADRFRQGKPDGLSTRMLASWDAAIVRGQRVQKFKKFKISTWDDMAPGELPAVPESRENYELLTDEMRRELDRPEDQNSKDLNREDTIAAGSTASGDGASDPSAGPNAADAIPNALDAKTGDTSLTNVAATEADDTHATMDAATHAAKNDAIHPAPGHRAGAQLQESLMNPEIKAVLDAYRATYATGDKTQVADARKAVVDEIARAKRLGVGVPELAAASTELATLDNTMQLAGLFTDRPGPSGTPGNQTSAATGAGHAPDLHVNSQATQADQVQDNKTTPPLRDGDGTDGDSGKKVDGTKGVSGALDAKHQEFLDQLMAKEEKAQLDSERALAVTDAIKKQAPDILKGLPDDVQEQIKGIVDKAARSADDVPMLLSAQVDLYSSAAAKERLRAGGVGNAKGNTVDDPSSTRVQGGADRPQKYMEGVDKLLAAADAAARRSPNGLDPMSPEVQARRKWNREHFIDPLMKQMDEIRAKTGSAASFQAAIDSYATDGERALMDSWDRLEAQVDISTLSNFYNQPTISTAMLIQSYQDLTALQYVDGIGPGENSNATWQNTSSGNGPGQTGWILVVPVETYASPGGAGTQALRSFGSYDAGLMPAENKEIPSGTASVNWLSFATLPRQIAATMTRHLRASAGLGPLNWDAIGRHIYHISADKNRRIDSALYNDMSLTSDEYLSQTVTGETVNNTYNSVYNAAGNVIVNLNPAKAASAPTTGTDPFIQYGANVTGAVRLATGASQYGTGTYCGTAYGVNPVLPARTSFDLKGAGGAYEMVNSHPVVVTAPGSASQGYLDGTNQVQTYPQTYGMSSAPSAATYAVDYEIGVIAFTSGVTGASGILTTTVTASYTYATNFDNFVAVNGGNVQNFVPISAANLAAGTAGVQKYLSSLVAQVGQTAAYMGSAPRFSQPNMALSSLGVAELIAQAEIFAPLFSPNGTKLYPTPDTYAERNGIAFGRHNSTWSSGDRRILVGRRGATKYGVGIPAQVNGPYPTYDTSTGGIKAVDTFYLEEFSTIATPIVTDANGVQYNPPFRTIIMRGPNG